MNKTGIELIANERQEQIEKHGYTVDADNQRYGQDDKDLVLAAMSYLYPPDHREYALLHPTRSGEYKQFKKAPITWPWDERYWKPSHDNRIKDLQKAGALIAAEIDRLLNLKSDG